MFNFELVVMNVNTGYKTIAQAWSSEEGASYDELLDRCMTYSGGSDVSMLSFEYSDEFGLNRRGYHPYLMTGHIPAMKRTSAWSKMRLAE
jgi:hypothetical protein